ncbi:MAG: hypothetical protein AB7F35_06530 [Acetobacteraceae bacterium]
MRDTAPPDPFAPFERARFSDAPVPAPANSNTLLFCRRAPTGRQVTYLDRLVRAQRRSRMHVFAPSAAVLLTVLAMGVCVGAVGTLAVVAHFEANVPTAPRVAVVR